MKNRNNICLVFRDRFRRAIRRRRRPHRADPLLDVESKVEIVRERNAGKGFYRNGRIAVVERLHRYGLLQHHRQRR